MAWATRGKDFRCRYCLTQTTKQLCWANDVASFEDGSFWSSLLSLALNREEFCRLSFFTMAWGAGTFLLLDTADGAAVRQFFLLGISESIMSCPSFELFPLFPGLGDSLSFLFLFGAPPAPPRGLSGSLARGSPFPGSQRLRQPEFFY